MKNFFKNIKQRAEDEFVEFVLSQDYTSTGGNYETKDGLNNGLAHVGEGKFRDISIRLKDGKIVDKTLVKNMLNSIGIEELHDFRFDDEHGGFVVNF